MPTSVFQSIAQDKTIKALANIDGTILSAGSSIFHSDILLYPLLAGDTWQSGPFDTVGTPHGGNAGYAVFAVSLITDVAGSSLYVDVSQDAIRWARVSFATVAPTVTTTLTGGTLGIGATSVPVTTTAGFLAGDTFVIGATTTAETLIVASGGVGATTLTPTAPTTKSHSTGVNVDGLYMATTEYSVRGFRYVRCAGINGAVNATINVVSARIRS